MKFNININQEKLSKIAPEANLIDGAILDYLYWFCSSANAELEAARITHEGRRYTWVNYDWMLKDMPLLKLKARSTITPILNRLEAWGFIKTYRENGGNGGGRKFITIESKTDGLFIDKLMKKPDAAGLEKLRKLKQAKLGK